MPLEPLAQRFLAMAAAGGRSAGRPSTEVRRAALAKLMGFCRADRMAGPGQDASFTGPGGAVPVRLYAPDGLGDAIAPGLVFFHGGGLVAGSLDTHDRVARALAAETGCRVVAVGYRLAPEHPFPAAVDDALAAVAWVAREERLRIDPAWLAVGGDSAGATLAALAAQHARAAGPALALQVLICPVLDSGAESVSRGAFAEGYLIDRATLQADLSDYLQGGEDPRDPLVSPLRAADLTGLPPTIVHTAEFDPMVDEGDAYAARLASAGVAVDATRHLGQVHNFHALGAVLPQGRAVLRRIGEQVRATLR